MILLKRFFRWEVTSKPKIYIADFPAYWGLGISHPYNVLHCWHPIMIKEGTQEKCICISYTTVTCGLGVKGNVNGGDMIIWWTAGGMAGRQWTHHIVGEPRAWIEAYSWPRGMDWRAQKGRGSSLIQMCCIYVPLRQLYPMLTLFPTMQIKPSILGFYHLKNTSCTVMRVLKDRHWNKSM